MGASRGPGYLMIQANARLRLDRVFAVVLFLTRLGLGLYGALSGTERVLRRGR